MTAESWKARDGSTIVIRPICPADEQKLARFHATLSEHSIYLRYFHSIALGARVTHDRLKTICAADQDREIVLMAESAEGYMIAVGRLNRDPGSSDAEFALLVSDAWHQHGLGTELLLLLISAAEQKGIQRVCGDVLSENSLMLA